MGDNRFLLGRDFLSPPMGRELADWIVDGRARDDFSQLSYDRVAQDRLFKQSYSGNRG